MIKQSEQEMPWLDRRLTKEALNHLWNSINQLNTTTENISRSILIQDKDDWFYENVLKEYSEYIYLSDWNNYYNVVVSKFKPPPVFTLEKMWVNYQKQYDFNPPHKHVALFSFVVFMKIPTHWKEQHFIGSIRKLSEPVTSDFQFLLGMKNSSIVQTVNIPLCPEDEGRILFFPSWLQHQNFPFYNTEEERITVAGNISYE